MEKKNIALVMGGFSGEHDISIASGNQVYGQLDHNKYNVYKIVVDREGWYWEQDGKHLPVDRGDFTVTDNGRKVRFDLAFIIIHGNPGENGVMQGGNGMGEILMMIRDCLRNNIEPSYNKDLLNQSGIYFLGERLAF